MFAPSAMVTARQRGFTIIELMITVAILAVLVTLSAPMFFEFFEKARIRAAADDVVTLLATARGEAVKRNRDVRVVFGGSSGAWCIGANAALDPASAGAAIPAATTCDCTNTAQCLIGGERFAVLGSSYDNIVSSSNVATEFVFDRSLGTQHAVGSDAPATSVTTFSSSPRNYRLRLTVSALGHTTVCVPTGAASISGYKSC